MRPGEIAASRLPPPLGVHTVGPSILGAAEALVQERAVHRLVERVPLIPHPLPLEPIAAPAAAHGRPTLPREASDAVIVGVHEAQQQEEDEGGGEDEEPQCAKVLEGLHPPPEPPQSVRALLPAAVPAAPPLGRRCGKRRRRVIRRRHAGAGASHESSVYQGGIIGIGGGSLWQADMDLGKRKE